MKMNGLSQGGKKSKDIMSLPPVRIKDLPPNIASGKEWIKTFLQANSADEQLLILKKNLDELKDPVDADIVNFLAIVIFYSEAKHPIKCFLMRVVMKSKHLQESFLAMLTSQIVVATQIYIYNNVSCHKDTISKIVMCLENFPPGTSAVANAAEKLAPYLMSVLMECARTFSNGDMPTSVIEKYAMYSLVHSAFKILLHIITKVAWKLNPHSDDEPALVRIFRGMCSLSHCGRTLKSFLYDKEVPMDTKLLCGLVDFALNGYTYPGINPPLTDWEFYMEAIQKDKESDEAQLALYSAIVMSVPMEELQIQYWPDETRRPVITVIVQALVDIVDRNASSGVLVLSAARALQHVGARLARLHAHAERTARALLAFVWRHLDHFMDAVRHLAADLLAALVAHCAATVRADPASEVLEEALAGVERLAATPRGYCAGVRACVEPLGAALGAALVLRRLAPLPRLLGALPSGAASRTLDALLARHVREEDARAVHDAWVPAVLLAARAPSSRPEVVAALAALLARAVDLEPKLLDYILPNIKQACAAPDYELQQVLVLLSVTRGCLARLSGEAEPDNELWGGILPYHILNEAVVDAKEEVRLGGLALACGGAGARGAVARGELRVVLHYLRHCSSERAPHARQQGLALLRKFVKRLLDGYRAAKRSGDDDGCRMYRDFDDQLRRQCYGALQHGAGYPRRDTALQLLRALEPQPLDRRDWNADYVEKLLVHLDDNYETNKAMALEILQHVPLDLLKDKSYSVSLEFKDIIRQAGVLEPTECVSAAYKLELIWRRLPENITLQKDSSIPEAVAYSAVAALLNVLRHGCFDCALYGALHCIAHLLLRIQPGVAQCVKWNILLRDVIEACDRMLEAAGRVVNAPAPEGVSPAPPSPPSPPAFPHFTHFASLSSAPVEDDRPGTARTVLLAAWRTVKEATAVLSAIGARAGCLPHVPRQLAERLAAVLLAARHRGAVELAHAALARLLHSMWRSEQAEVSRYPPRMLARLLAYLRGAAPGGLADGLGALSADRRSAGLPFYVQALVSTEAGLKAGAPGSALQQVMTQLLSLADADASAVAGADATVRAHACNILRALYKDSAFDTAVQCYVGEGLRVALRGFEGATWAERNSSTLLLSALMTRVFGVWRSRRALSAHNRMTGHAFFARYPHLYDIMLNKLKEASESEEKLLLCPSLYPVLLILARLYPSALEGADSNLKLTSFVPYVVRCARSRVLLTRRLAARACQALITPDRYAAHILELVRELGAATSANLCHGLLLQICALLDNKPDGAECSSLSALAASTQWMLRRRPLCYPLLHQYVLMLTALLTRFEEVVIPRETRDKIAALLHEIVFPPSETAREPGGAGGGRELCLAECLRLLLALSPAAHLPDVIMRAMQHDVDEVSGAALDHVLARYGRGAEADADAEEEAAEEAAEEADGLEAAAGADAVLSALAGRADYLQHLARALPDECLWRRDPARAAKYLEMAGCASALELVLSARPLGFVPPRPCLGFVLPRGAVPQLVAWLVHGPANVAHLYLETLLRYACENVESLAEFEWLQLVYVSQALCGHRAQGGARARRVLGAALRTHGARLRTASPATAAHASCFVLAATARLLRAPERDVRALAAAAVAALLPPESGGGRQLVCAAAGAALLAACAEPALLADLALADGNATLWPHDPRDQCPFESEGADANADDEAEAALWTRACAARLARVAGWPRVRALIRDRQFPVHFDAGSLLQADAGQHVCNPLVRVFLARLKEGDALAPVNG